MELTVEGKARPEGSKPRALRRDGLVPAVLYGHKGTESVEFTLPAKVVETLLKQPSLGNRLISLDLPDASWSGRTLLREVQTHPWKAFPYHLSFFSVENQTKVEVEVPLHFVGTAVGVTSGGILEALLSSLKVVCKPDAIPEAIEVDVTDLQVGQGLQVSDLTVPDGIQVQISPSQLIVGVQESRMTRTAAATA